MQRFSQKVLLFTTKYTFRRVNLEKFFVSIIDKYWSENLGKSLKFRFRFFSNFLCCMKIISSNTKCVIWPHYKHISLSTMLFAHVHICILCTKFKSNTTKYKVIRKYSSQHIALEGFPNRRERENVIPKLRLSYFLYWKRLRTTSSE